MNYIIFNLFSGVGFCNQLFSLETAIYMANILNRKLILIIKNPLCHKGSASWDNGKFLDFFSNRFLKHLPDNYIDVHYKPIPTYINEIIENNNKTEKHCIHVPDDCPNQKFSHLLFIEKDDYNTIDKNKLKNILHNRYASIMDLKNNEKEYLHITFSNASRCFYNFLTTKNNYSLMNDICTSLCELKSTFYEAYKILNLPNEYMGIHFRFGDQKHKTEAVNFNAIRITKNIFHTIDNFNTNKLPIIAMCDRRDIDFLKDLNSKYTVIYSDEIVETIDYNKYFPEYKSLKVVKFLMEKLILHNASVFIGTDCSTVSNHIQYCNYLHGKNYQLYTDKIIKYQKNVPSWTINGIAGAGISWRVFFKDNIPREYNMKYKRKYSFITLTNNGYKELTCNLIYTLKKLGIDDLLKIYCIGEESYNYFQKNYTNSESVLVNPKESHLSTWCQYYAMQNPNEEGKKIWADLTSYKFYSIHNELVNGNDVIFVDGDIIFNKNPIPHLLSNIKDNDLLIQNDEQSDDNPRMCTGFFYLKSTPYTINMSNFENITKNISTFTNDQQYLRRHENNMKVSYLKLAEFPNGKYWRENLPKEHYIIHFNYDTGTHKINRMKKYNHWYIDKPDVFQLVNNPAPQINKKDTDKPCIIYSERRVGFFSSLLGIIYEAYNYKKNHNKTPYIIWKNPKYQRNADDNVFDYFFDQPIEQPAFEKSQIINERGYRLSTVLEMAKNNNNSFRDQFNLMIQDICKMKPYYKTKIEILLDSLDIKNKIGFHIRQTDRNIGSSRGIIYSGPSSDFVKKNIVKDNRNFYLATDCKDTYAEFKNLFNCISITNIRSTGCTSIHQNNNPCELNFIKGEEALLESWMLANTKYLYRTTSNVTIFSLCLNPKLEYMDLCKNFKKEIEQEKNIDNLFLESFLEK